jgi:hypothetical protein
MAAYDEAAAAACILRSIMRYGESLYGGLPLQDLVGTRVNSSLGAIQSCWGGTSINIWLSAAGVAKCPTPFPQVCGSDGSGSRVAGWPGGLQRRSGCTETAF